MRNTVIPTPSKSLERRAFERGKTTHCLRNARFASKGGQLWPRIQLSLPDAPLTLSNRALMTLRTTARAMGVDEARLASDLLETITKDDLFKAVLDVEEAA